MGHRHGARARLLAASALASIAVCWTPLAIAQEADGEEGAERIVVTGSRVARTGFDAPNPVTVMDSELADNLGIVNVGDTLRRLPQNTAFFTETNVGIGNFNVGSQLANLRGLNPFFGTRTLTLVNTRRVVPTSEGGAVDLTLIPSILVGRTEVVTGGASAAYGSDAIAGVVNVILDTELEGFKGQVDYGQTFQGDGGDKHAALAFGSSFAGDRGHILVGGEYQRQDGIGVCDQVRDWCAESWAIFTNPGFASGNGNPNFVLGPNARATYTETGVLRIAPPGAAVSPAQFLTFNEAGDALLPWDSGDFFTNAGNRQGGDGRIGPYSTSNIRPDVERYSGLAHVSYDLTSSLEAFVETAYARSEALSFPANGGLGASGNPIAADNAFLPAEVASLLDPGEVITFSRLFMPDVISGRNTTTNETFRFVTGLEGDLFAGWGWDAYYQYGRNENHQRLFNNMVGRVGAANTTHNFLAWALDAVHEDPLDPTSPIVCRQTLLGNPLAEGCVPLNLFGLDNSDPAALEYVYRTLKEDSVYVQHVVGANVRGDLFQGWAGPFAVAAGAEWRRDEADTTHDIANQPWYPSYFLSYGLDRGGEIEVLEGYAELSAPLLRDLPLAELLQVDLAARQTRNEATSSTSDASASHEFSSWKASAIYDATDWLRVRGTLSRDVRAAGFRELFLPFVTNTSVSGTFGGGVNNPWAGGANQTYQLTTGGNPDLEPEEADTKTLGVVLSPQGPFDGLRLSADWYEIDLAGAITLSPGGQPLVNACFASGGAGAACAKITGAGTPTITAIDARAINIGSYVTRGYDFEASYNLPLSRLDQGLGGDVDLRVIASYLYDVLIDAGLGGPVVNVAGQTGPVASFGNFNTSPEWRGNAWLTYTNDRFSTTLEAQYIQDGILDVARFESPPGSSTNTLANSISDNNVDGRTYWALSASYQLPVTDERSVEVFAAVNNIFDEDPPVAPGGNAYPTNPVYFDTLGARFRAGVRFEF